VVDDEFFKLSEMINFLESEEKLEATKDKQKNEDFIDMFQDISFDKVIHFLLPRLIFPVIWDLPP